MKRSPLISPAPATHDVERCSTCPFSVFESERFQLDHPAYACQRNGNFYRGHSAPGDCPLRERDVLVRLR